MIAKLLSALEAFQKAHEEINNLWGGEFLDNEEVNKILTREYPFGVSFDEIEIKTWVEDVKKQLNQKDPSLIRYIYIATKEWWDKTNGNTYFSAVVTVNFGMDNEKEFGIEFQYGDSSHAYSTVVKEKMIAKGFLPEFEDSLWRYCDKNGIKLQMNKQEGCLKRDVQNFTKDVG